MKWHEKYQEDTCKRKSVIIRYREYGKTKFCVPKERERCLDKEDMQNLYTLIQREMILDPLFLSLAVLQRGAVQSVQVHSCSAADMTRAHGINTLPQGETWIIISPQVVQRQLLGTLPFLILPDKLWRGRLEHQRKCF